MHFALPLFPSSYIINVFLCILKLQSMLIKSNLKVHKLDNLLNFGLCWHKSYPKCQSSLVPPNSSSVSGEEELKVAGQKGYFVKFKDAQSDITIWLWTVILQISFYNFYLHVYFHFKSLASTTFVFIKVYSLFITYSSKNNCFDFVHKQKSNPVTIFF